jgi:hypothetical protein
MGESPMRFLTGLFLVGCSTLFAADDAVKNLFNGKDLTGWQVSGGKKEVWGAENGSLFVDTHGGGWLLTEATFSDFELRFEYKMCKAGNSGVALRTPPQGNPAYVGMEIQLIDDIGWTASKLEPWQHTGSVYDVQPAAKIANKPVGEWNKMFITCKGKDVKIVHNDEVLVDTNLEKYSEKFKKHPGLLRTEGHIGFQSHDGRIEFKNVTVKELK